ncbi:MAG: hypothetical protein M9965_15665 [Anaerolineae bacterium]|nr:hypothetical protein [Anaerolineae bacterium]
MCSQSHNRFCRGVSIFSAEKQGYFAAFSAETFFSEPAGWGRWRGMVGR